MSASDRLRIAPTVPATVEPAADLVCPAVAEAPILRLSVEDQRAVADGILDPPSPNDALRRAASAHRRLVR